MRRKWVVWILGGAAAAAFLALVALLDFPGWQRLDMEKLDGAAQTTLVYDAQNREIAGLYALENRVWLPLSEIPTHVQLAFVAAEDARFFAHPGVDVTRIGGAIVANLRSGSAGQGASTITQQLIKLTHLSAEKTLSRKANEAYLALRLERALSKDEILEKYLNVVYFGAGAYGIEAAARTYYAKGASALSLDEAALLAGTIKSPSRYAPHIAPENALDRREYVLKAMESSGYITEAERDEAMAAPLTLDMPKRTDGGWYVDAAIDEACALLDVSADELLTGGYRVYTEMDADMQAEMERLFEDASRFPANAEDGTPSQAAMIALDAQTGAARALVGGREYAARRGLNRATQMRRQPGSAFKPVSVYAAAVDAHGYVPASVLDDTERDFEGGYHPRNSGGESHGAVTMRVSLARSLNVASVSLAERVGVASVREYARRFGLPLDESDSGLSIALGSLTDGVSPSELCAAYAALANGGASVDAYIVSRIENAEGELLYEHRRTERRALRETSAFLITDMLASAASWGSAKALNSVGFPVAAKTGTVGFADHPGNRDAWVAAYTPSLAVTVWMGFDRPDESHCLSNASVGGGYPARLAAAYLQSINGKADSGEFPVPDGITPVVLDAGALAECDARIAGAMTPEAQCVTEYFTSGTLPTEVSTIWDAPARVADLRLSLSENARLPELRFTALSANAVYVVCREANGSAEEIAALRGNQGETLVFTDENPVGACAYYVVPRHAAHLAEGRVVDGEASVRLDWQGQKNAPPAAVNPLEALENRPLFGD